MIRHALKMLWVLANNRKTGEIPAAYIGTTRDEAWNSCKGCPLRDDSRCYAWTGMNAMIFAGQHTKRYATDPARYSLAAVLATWRGRQAKAARIGVLGDPARVARGDLWAAIKTLRAAGLAVLAYTHFWRERSSRNLRTDVMASCDVLAEADEALALGFRPAVILPQYHDEKTFVTPGGARGVVCPAQTKDSVTCDSCRMCDPKHPVWAAGKVEAIGFLEHSKKALSVKRKQRADKTLPLFPKEPLSGWRGKAGKPPEKRRHA